LPLPRKLLTADRTPVCRFSNMAVKRADDHGSGGQLAADRRRERKASACPWWVETRSVPHRPGGCKSAWGDNWQPVGILGRAAALQRRDARIATVAKLRAAAGPRRRGQPGWKGWRLGLDAHLLLLCPGNPLLAPSLGITVPFTRVLGPHRIARQVAQQSDQVVPLI